MQDKVLMIEDDENIRELVEVNIKDLGLDFEWAADGETGLQMALDGDYSLVLLDLMLPKLGGMTVCERLREKKDDLPIIMLTARGEELDRVMGLELGADDYLTKPFSVPELLARIKAVLRRSHIPADNKSGNPMEENKIVISELEIDLMRRKVLLSGENIKLSVKEFDILAFLAANPGRPYSREQLLESVWGYHSEAYESNVNQHITRLRRKIEADPTNPRYIKTVWGLGYRFSEPEELEE